MEGLHVHRHYHAVTGIMGGHGSLDVNNCCVQAPTYYWNTQQTWKRSWKLPLKKKKDITDKQKYKIVSWLIVYQSQLSLGNMWIMTFVKLWVLQPVSSGGLLTCLEPELMSRNQRWLRCNNGRKWDIVPCSLLLLDTWEFSSCDVHGPHLILQGWPLPCADERPLREAQRSPGTQHVCLSGSVSGRNFVVFYPIRGKSAWNDSWDVSDLDIRNIPFRFVWTAVNVLSWLIWLF